MAEYIDRQAVKDAMTQSVCGDTWEVEKAVEAVRQLPAADVVPVVRCRDCKHLGTFRGKLYCRHNCGVVKPKEDDFCSYGERKD